MPTQSQPAIQRGTLKLMVNYVPGTSQMQPFIPVVCRQQYWICWNYEAKQQQRGPKLGTQLIR